MKRAVQQLLGSIVDYAGLFPPAALAMPEAVAAYAGARAGHGAWLLGSFVVTASRLAELVDAAAPQVDAGTARWPLSVILDAAGAAGSDDRGASRALETLAPHGARFELCAFEIPPLPAAELTPLAAALGARVERYFEVPLDGEALAPRLAAAARAGVAVKVRTGGVTPEAFPAPEALAAFLRAARAVGVPFKATAGLHHALTGPQSLATGEGACEVAMQGFLNLAVAAALLDVEPALGSQEITELLAAPHAGGLEWDELGLSVRGRRLSGATLAAGRGRFFRSFGSCSFEEPLAEVEALYA